MNLAKLHIWVQTACSWLQLGSSLAYINQQFSEDHSAVDATRNINVVDISFIFSKFKILFGFGKPAIVQNFFSCKCERE